MPEYLRRPLRQSNRCPEKQAREEEHHQQEERPEHHDDKFRQEKRCKIGRMYQGIGLLAAEEVGEGLVKGSAVHQITLERPSEAKGDDFEQKTGEGCEGLRHVFLDSENDPLHKGGNLEKPFTNATT